MQKKKKIFAATATLIRLKPPTTHKKVLQYMVGFLRLGHIFQTPLADSELIQTLTLSSVEFEKALKWSKTPVCSPRFFKDFGSKRNLQQSRCHLKALFTVIAMVQVPASYDLPRLRYRMQYWSTSNAHS